MRRMEHALLRGDIRMLHDPMRAQSVSFIAGCVSAVVVIAASRSCGCMPESVMRR